MKTKLILLLLIINSGLYAQDTNIIYHDVNPDYIVTAPPLDTFKIDINDDGLNDVAFYIVYTSPIWHYVSNLHLNCNYAFFNQGQNDSLTGSFYWQNTSFSWLHTMDSTRIAVRLIDGTDYYYGWVRVKFDSENVSPYKKTITIKEYAFCKIANYPFLFGQTELATSVNELPNENNTQVYFNGSTSNIVIQSDKQLKEVKLVNMLGATVRTANNINSLNANISTNNLAHGNYIVQVKFKDASVYAVQVAF